MIKYMSLNQADILNRLEDSGWFLKISNPIYVNIVDMVGSSHLFSTLFQNINELFSFQIYLILNRRKALKSILINFNEYNIASITLHGIFENTLRPNIYNTPTDLVYIPFVKIANNNLNYEISHY